MPHLQLQQFGLQNRSQSPLPKFGKIFIADHISDACKTQVTVDVQPYCHPICIQLRERAVIDILSGIAFLADAFQLVTLRQMGKIISCYWS